MDAKQYILDERKKGTSDVQIFQNLQKINVPELNPRGWAGQILPIGTGIAGGIAGGALGGIPGATAGAAIGGAIGETAQQGLESVARRRKNLNLGQIVGAGVTQGLLEAGGQVATRVAGAVTKPVIEATRVPIVNFISKMSGYAEDVVTQAMKRTPGVVSALQKGEAALGDIIKSAVTKFHEFSQSALDASKATMKHLDATLSLGGRGQTASRNVLLNEAKDFVSNVTTVLRNEHNIGVTSKGELLFERTSMPSRIVTGSEKSAIQESFNLLNNIKKDTSISNIDATLERMIVFQRKTPAGTPTGPESKKVIGEIISQLKDFAKKVYPQVADEIEKNFQQRILISQGKEILGESAHLSPKDLSLLTKRMLQMFNTGNLAVRESTQAIAKQTGQDIPGAAAGMLMKQGEQVSIRAQNLTRRGVIEKAFEFIPRAMLKNYVQTGRISGELLNSPTLKGLAKSAGITVDALVREVVTSMQSNTAD